MSGPKKDAEKEKLIDFCAGIARNQWKRDGGKEGDGDLFTREEIEEDIDNPFSDED